MGHLAMPAIEHGYVVGYESKESVLLRFRGVVVSAWEVLMLQMSSCSEALETSMNEYILTRQRALFARRQRVSQVLKFGSIGCPDVPYG